MSDEILEQFKTVTRRHVDLRRMIAKTGGDEAKARELVAQGLRELADEFEPK